jgi:hypothetical protein
MAVGPSPRAFDELVKLELELEPELKSDPRDARERN